jgi:hypothetical protein
MAGGGACWAALGCKEEDGWVVEGGACWLGPWL